MNYTALIVAAGKGLRANLGYNKVLYYMDKHENTILGKTLDFFKSDERCCQIIVVTSQDDYAFVKEEYQAEKIEFVLGGAQRQDSVYNGLKVVKEDYVLIHDGNRPFIKMRQINEILLKLKDYNAVLLAVDMSEHVKLVKDGYISNSLDRNKLKAAQTPQSFRTQTILDAYQHVNENHLVITDDIQAVELSQNAQIAIVTGSLDNRKITWSDDFKKL